MSKEPLPSFVIKRFRFLKIFGFATFSVKDVSDEKVYISRTDAAYFCGNLIVALIMLYFSLIYEPTSAETSILTYVTIFVMDSASLVCIISIICVLCFRNQIWKLVRRVDCINIKFSQIGIEIDVRGFVNVIIIMVASLAGLQTIGLCIMGVMLNYQLGILIHFAYLTTSFSANMCWVMLFHVAINRRYRKMNHLLREMIASTRPANVENTVVTLQAIHYDLIKCIKLTNTIFSFQVMLCIGVSYLFTFFTLFASYKAFYHNIDSHKSISISSLFWSFYYNLIKITMILVCQQSESENDETSRLISKLMNRGICSPMQLQSFGNQARGASAKSSCGLFNFDLSLIGMIISSMVTYFIIFVQFEIALQAKSQ